MISLLAEITKPLLIQDQVLVPHLVIFLIAFATALLATPIVRRIALVNNIVDKPDLLRKTHLAAIPYLGGLAIFLAWIAGMAACYFIQPQHTPANSPLHAIHFPIPILLGAIIILVVGLADDIYRISPRVKIGGQILAAAMLASQHSNGQLLGAKLVIDSFQIIHVDVAYPLAYFLGTGITALFVVSGCNALNLLDGLDGLAAGVTAIAFLGFLFISLVIAVFLQGNAQPANADPYAASMRIVICLATLGAVLGFLPYNFNPASIFMGDAGSLLLGYLSVATIFSFANTPSFGPFYVLIALMIFATPIVDTALAVIRRVIRRQPIFSPDNLHLHHQLFRLMQGVGLPHNVSVKLAVLCIYALSTLFALLGCAMIYLRWRYVLTVFFVLAGIILASAVKSATYFQQVNQPPNQNENKPAQASTLPIL